MFLYCLELAWLSLRRNVFLTILMVAAIGVGVGSSMAIFTVLRAMAADPIPGRSSRLYKPQIDSWGPESRVGKQTGPAQLEDQLTYLDATQLIQASPAKRQTAMYALQLPMSPRNQKPFTSRGRAVDADFFGMFGIGFKQGSPWSRQDEENRANVVVIGTSLAGRLFSREPAIGQSLDLDGHEFRVVGVIDSWNPIPRFYDLSVDMWGEGEQFFVPFSTAIANEMPTAGDDHCREDPSPGWTGHMNSECLWIQVWVELPDADARRAYHQFLHNYASAQQSAGRFDWPPKVELQDVRSWLRFKRVVPDEVRISAILGFGFLGVCLINAIGLMLAKFSTRDSEYGVRRALGASRLDIFSQCIAESALVGVLGGILGLGLTTLGLAAQRIVLGPKIGNLAVVDAATIATTLTLAVFATVCAALYPSWRACTVQPAWQLKGH